jgi:hypothetical protein
MVFQGLSNKCFGTHLALSRDVQDLMWIALTVAFFAMGLYYASGCDRL